MGIDWLVLALLTCGPMALGMAFLWWKISRRAARERWPFDDLAVRPAGESTRLEAAAWNEKLSKRTGLAVLIPVAMLVALGSQPRMHGPALIAVPVITTLVAWGTFRWIWQALEKWRSYNLGFEGERFVGAELDLLAAAGFQVCHDVPFGKWNIDHVVVGPTGIWAVETKSRRMPAADGRKIDWTVRVHADALEFPWGRDRSGLEQAERNAKSLREWLARATGEKIDVKPVLALPGWMVDRRTRNPVMVISARNAAGIFAKGPRVLGDDLIKRIAFQLREKSRICLRA